MARINRVVLPPGYPRVAPQTALDDIETVSTALDSTNLAEEGLDRRNFLGKELSNFDAADRVWAKGWTTNTVIAAVGAFEAETTAPITLGTAVEIDWSASPLVLTSGQKLVIEAHVPLGYTTNPIAVAGVDVSAALIIQLTSGAYVVYAASRASIRTEVATVISRRTLVLHYVLGSGSSIDKIGVAFGCSGNVYVGGAQIVTYLLKRVL